MTTPTQHDETNHPQDEERTHSIGGSAEPWGPLIQQPASAARLARILHRSAQDLWDACTNTDCADMWDEARAIAGRILAAAPGDCRK